MLLNFRTNKCFTFTELPRSMSRFEILKNQLTTQLTVQKDHEVDIWEIPFGTISACQAQLEILEILNCNIYNTLQHCAAHCSSLHVYNWNASTATPCNSLQLTTCLWLMCMLNLVTIWVLRFVWNFQEDLEFAKRNCVSIKKYQVAVDDVTRANAEVCCSVLQSAAVCCSVLQCGAVSCSVLQYVAVCCIALQCVCSVLLSIAVCCNLLHGAAVCSSIWQCVPIH